MDRQDITLSLILLANSRTTLRTIAQQLNISVNAVHKRIRALEGQKVIRKFTAKVSHFAAGNIPIQLYGHTGSEVSQETVKVLGNEEHTYWVALAGGNHLYIGAYLKDIGELDRYVSFISQNSGMSDPTVGIIGFVGQPMTPQPLAQPTLSDIDYRIIFSLRNDSRRPMTEVAQELGLSAKTVQKHLDRMVAEGSIELSIQWYPDATDDIVSVFHIKTTTSEDKSKVAASLTNKYFPKVLFNFAFSNLPCELMAMTWSNNMRDLKELRDTLQKEKGIQSISTNILFTGYIFDTWRDDLVEAKAKQE